jgi:hypothetical protein
MHKTLQPSLDRMAVNLRSCLASPASDVKEARKAREAGWGKAKIILEVWGVTKGDSPKYKAAEAEYKWLIEESA